MTDKCNAEILLLRENNVKLEKDFFPNILHVISAKNYIEMNGCLSRINHDPIFVAREKPEKFNIV